MSPSIAETWRRQAIRDETLLARSRAYKAAGRPREAMAFRIAARRVLLTDAPYEPVHPSEHLVRS